MNTSGITHANVLNAIANEAKGIKFHNFEVEIIQPFIEKVSQDSLIAASLGLFNLEAPHQHFDSIEEIEWFKEAITNIFSKFGYKIKYDICSGYTVIVTFSW